MTDKEKEAIEYFKKRIDICMENANICDDNNFDEEATCLRKEQILIETVLNLIQTKQAEIEKYKKDYIDISKRANEYKKAIECKKCDCSVCEAHLNNIELQSELEKKDKTIDEMAKNVEKAIEYMEHYIKVEPNNENVKREFREVIEILKGKSNEI